MTYEIADEPTPNEGLAKFVFHPTAPLLGAMICGAWLAWPWFILNAYAMGSPTIRREMKLCAIGVAGTAVLALGVFALVDAGVIESRVTLQIALLGITAWKLGMAYAVTTVQQRTFYVYTYYGGTVQKAFYVLVAGSYIRDLIVGLSESPVWRVIVSGGV